MGSASLEATIPAARCASGEDDMFVPLRFHENASGEMAEGEAEEPKNSSVLQRWCDGWERCTGAPPLTPPLPPPPPVLGSLVLPPSPPGVGRDSRVAVLVPVCVASALSVCHPETETVLVGVSPPTAMRGEGNTRFFCGGVMRSRNTSSSSLAPATEPEERSDRLEGPAAPRLSRHTSTGTLK
jgi:hypothetical protein